MLSLCFVRTHGFRYSCLMKNAPILNQFQLNKKGSAVFPLADPFLIVLLCYCETNTITHSSN